MTRAYIALGSNLGDRQGHLSAALSALRQHPGVTVTQVSSFLETEPVGGPPGQGDYLNGAAELETSLEPDRLLEALFQIEEQLGRVRAERFGPRTIDLDLLLYGSQTRETKTLTLPHPRMHERYFVLKPLAEIAPGVVHPELGLTIEELLNDLRRKGPESEAAPSSHRGRELAGLRAVVTGSTSGIGRAIALEMARAGASVVIHGHRSKTAGLEVAEKIDELGTEAVVLMADLQSAEERRELIEKAWSHWDGVDIWVNNAGADTLTGANATLPFEEKLDLLWKVDVQATVALSRVIGDRMRNGSGGVILNMGWDQAETGMEGDSGQLFSTIKSAIMSFSKSLAVSLAPEVRVNCLAPGWIRTAWGEMASEQWQQRAVSEAPLARWGSVEDVAAAARWLASPAAGFITGQVIRINGGAVRS